MYETSYGDKYAEFFTGPDGKSLWRTAAEIAKAIRLDIKAEVKAGRLPKVTYSVRVHNYSGGRSINIEIRDMESAWVAQDSPEADESNRYYHYYNTTDLVISTEAKRVQDAVESIRSAYGFDGSEVQVDYFNVNYYGTTNIETAWGSSWRAQEKAAKAAKKTAATSRS